MNTNNATFLVTAKHVLFDRKTGKLLSNTVEVRSYSKDPADRNPNVLELDLTALEVKAHATQDIAVVKILNIGEVKPSTFATLHRNPVKNLILFSYLPTQSASTNLP